MPDYVVTLICDKCKGEYTIKGKSYRQRIRRGAPNYCNKCMKLYSIEKANITKANMSDERKAEYSRKLSDANKKYWEQLGDELKQERFDQLRRQNDNLQMSMTPDKKRELILKIAEGKSKMTPEAIADMKSKMSRSMTAHHANMSSDEKQKFRQQIKDGMGKMTEKEKEDMKNAWVKWWNNLHQEERMKHMTPAIVGLNNYWNTISPEEKKSHVRKTIISSGGKNNLHRKFESYFRDSYISNSYYLSPEVVLNNNDVFHSWDYGIYSKESNELVMVVDLDGAFYHADDCDYNGLQSHEEYDERRSLSISNNSNIIPHIIQEYNFSKCFEGMIKKLMLNYDEYVDQMFKEFRNMPFPSPHYSDRELLKSYNQLLKLQASEYLDVSINTRVGDRLIQHFHESIYHAHRARCISPYDAWYNDELLRKCIENRIIYQNYLNLNKILQGFNVSKIAPKVSVFSAGRAKLIISKYLSDYDIIFDPFSGFSGRMLGTISLGKQYIGQDISQIHVNESNKIISFLRQFFDVHATVTQRNILDSSSTYQCLFTCPPYGDKEQWLDVPVDKRTCDNWIDECLNRFKCRKYVFVVDETERYRENVVYELRNKSHLNGNSEYIIVV